MARVWFLIMFIALWTWVDSSPAIATLQNPHVMVLAYHKIDGASDSIYSVSERTFNKQMAYLKNASFHSITLEQFDAWLLKGTLLPEKPVLITFDDGEPSQFEKAVPILKYYGFTGVFFLIADRLAYVKQVGGLLNENFSVGSHSLSHKNLLSLSPADVEREISESKKIIGKTFKKNISFFAYPYGIFRNSHMETLIKNGYHGAFTIVPGVNSQETDPFELRRYMVLKTDTFAQFKATVGGDERELTSLLQGLILSDLQRKLYKLVEIEAETLLNLDKNNFIALRAKAMIEGQQFGR